MKNSRILSFMAPAMAAVALLTGCSTDNDFENKKESFADLELASVKSSDMQTRAVIDGTEFPTDRGNIGLFLYANEAASQKYGDGYDNVQYSYNSIKEKWTATPSIKTGSTPGYIYGYYPYKAGYTNIKAIPVASSINGDDVMYAEKQGAITDMTAAHTTITMSHALARVVIKVVNKGYTGNAKLSKIKFSGVEIAKSGTLNATDGSITATKSDVSLDVPTANQNITASGTIYECLLVPSKVETGRQNVSLTLTIDGEDKSLTLSGNNGVIFEQGVKSAVTITLSNTGIALQSVDINNWQTVTIGSHKVTVALSDYTPARSVMFSASVDGGAVKIDAYSKTEKPLVCTTDGNGTVSDPVISNNIYSFTISNITSDVVATVGYALSQAIPGRFSVGDGVQVYFSPGNLIYAKGNNDDWSDASWGFFENQYDYVQTENIVSYFPWGCKADWSKNPNDWRWFDYSSYATDGDNYNYDFGWGPQIAPSGTWRILTHPEWRYLFEDNTRKNKWGSATVNGVHGTIILPDVFTDPQVQGDGGNAEFVPNADNWWDTNKYTAVNWQKMQAAGAVFLPSAACYTRDSYITTSPSDAGNYGYYWSSTTRSGAYGYCPYLSRSGVSPTSTLQKDYRSPVRLVSDYK